MIAEMIRKNVVANGGHYVPGARSLFNIPKKGFTLRYALETGLPDRVLYHTLASRLIPIYDKLIPWNSFGHRFDYEEKRSRDRYTFKPGVESWKHFVGAAKSALGPGGYLVSTDVANCFEHIQLSYLQQRMDDLARDMNLPQDLATELAGYRVALFQYLKEWCYGAGRGLPQNRDASSFLANVYLRDVDLAMIAAGYRDTYFRYMDDIKIVCTDEYQARKALKQLTIELRNLGLSLNAKKTEIVPASDWDAIDKCLDDGSDEIQKIDEIWRRRTRSAIFRVWPLLREKVLSLVASGEVDSREFRYCITRIGRMARYKDLHFPSSLYAPVTKAICKAITTHPASTDQYVEYLLAVEVGLADLQEVVDYISDPQRSIYTWQNYRLWLLFAEKGLDCEQLRSAARAALARHDSPDRAGASVYLGAIGCNDGRALIAKRFSDLDSFIGQRAALIALHEEPYRSLRDHLQVVRPDLNGVYKNLNKSSHRGTYFAPRDETYIEDLLPEAAYE